MNLGDILSQRESIAREMQVHHHHHRYLGMNLDNKFQFWKSTQNYSQTIYESTEKVQKKITKNYPIWNRDKSLNESLIIMHIMQGLMCFHIHILYESRNVQNVGQFC